jgi:hypothetical protein
MISEGKFVQLEEESKQKLIDYIKNIRPDMVITYRDMISKIDFSRI